MDQDPRHWYLPRQAELVRIPWALLVLTVATVTSALLAGLSLRQTQSLRAELEELRATVHRTGKEMQVSEEDHAKTQKLSVGPGSEESYTSSPEIEQKIPQVGTGSMRSLGQNMFQPCLQMMADYSRSTFLRDHKHTAIPWLVGLRRGTALTADGDTILVREEGFYLVYSQVYYVDATFVMGHTVNRKRHNVVGDESPTVTLFRCLQNMNPAFPYNTCFTAGIVKLEAGDSLELLIPRNSANVSLEGDTTFFGAIKLL